MAGGDEGIHVFPKCISLKVNVIAQQEFEIPEDLPGAMNNREKWRERVRDIRACSMT